MSKFALVSNITGEADVWKKLFDIVNKSSKDLFDAQQSYNGAIKETTRVLAQEDKQMDKLVEKRDKLNAKSKEELELEKMKMDLMETSVIKVDTSNIKIPSLAPILAGIQAPIREVQSLVIDLGNAIQDTFISSAEAVGNFFGELATGQASAGDFLSVIGSVFADMAITVGKIIIAAAVAKGALDSALVTFGGAGAALAAGIALVAIGSAVKGALRSAASGGGGGGSSSSYSSPNNFTYDTTSKVKAIPIEVHITGKLTGKGSDLAAIIEYETQRKKVVT
jgi:hypothetical protein